MESMLPTVNMIDKGNKSPSAPYTMEDSAVPPVVAAEKNPSIAPRLPFGRANIIDAPKIVFPAQLRNELSSIQQLTDIKSFDKNAAIEHKTEVVNPTAIM